MKETADNKLIEVSVRRSPRLSGFMAGSAILGFLLTLAITSFFEPDPAVGFVALFAYFALFGVSGTVAIGLVLWLIVDWRSKKRLSRATLEKEATS